ncbi:hypothetical protein [Abyssalbus ytuae]|uniref:Uncharacterized protein n=1 Tax=Abyssalbus ytuae TaxID=2926907 RepID=A0A9E7D1E1_9FLAO|nr:hypothetical protein [Abyssalbus ytuae]UOB19240.1 hypothetical protein MQE35_08055 [Abyssalbus ytuae]
MKKISPLFIIKGILLFLVYSTLSVYTLFFVPSEVPEKASLQKVTIASDSLYCMIRKNSKKSYLSTTYKGTEIKSIEFDKKACLEILGSNEFLLQVKEKPESYTLLIGEKAGLFKKKHKLYEVTDNNKVLLSYDESAKVFQNQTNMFRYFSIGFFSLMLFILGKSFYKKLKS